MLGLIYLYILNPTQENAVKIREYNRKHPLEMLIIAPKLQARISHVLQEK